MNNDNAYTMPDHRPLDLQDLETVVLIESPCKAVRINFEDWYAMDMPVWCGYVPIEPCDDVEPNSIQAIR